MHNSSIVSASRLIYNIITLAYFSSLYSVNNSMYIYIADNVSFDIFFSLLRYIQWHQPFIQSRCEKISEDAPKVLIFSYWRSQLRIRALLFALQVLRSFPDDNFAAPVSLELWQAYCFVGTFQPALLCVQAFTFFWFSLYIFRESACSLLQTCWEREQTF